MREREKNGYWVDSKLAISALVGVYKVQWGFWKMPEAGRKDFPEKV